MIAFGESSFGRMRSGRSGWWRDRDPLTMVRRSMLVGRTSLDDEAEASGATAVHSASGRSVACLVGSDRNARCGILDGAAGERQGGDMATEHRWHPPLAPDAENDHVRFGVSWRRRSGFFHRRARSAVAACAATIVHWIARALMHGADAPAAGSHARTGRTRRRLRQSGRKRRG